MNETRIAMWSGPRNISTAMLRSWGNRPDTFVCDEPFYAYYLKQTGIDHPGRDEVIAHHESDWRKVVLWLTGEIPEGRSVFYQKHMAHHLLPEIDRGWLDSVTNAFLIRDPREMLTSLIRVTPEPTVADTGLPQQSELFDRMREQTGRTPPVLDSRDVLDDPRGLLTRLCEALELPFADSMLSWEAGRRETDGIWAKHWYDAVERSTAFQPYQPKTDEVPPRLREVHEQCKVHYEKLHAARLRV
jgi:hypothetical protein